MPQGRPPSDGLQFFGTVKFEAKTGALTVSLFNLAGERIYSVDLAPHG
jgi:alkaline phosphatase D